MNKTEVAAELECSTRQVEKYAAENRLGGVEYVRGKRGREARYTEAAVASLRAELERERQEVIGHAPAQALERQASAEGMQAFALMFADALQGSQAPKMLLALTDAAEVSGLSASHLLDAIHDGRLDGRKIGRGFKIRPADLQEYAKQVWKDAPEYEKPKAKKLGNGLKVKASKA